MEGNFFIAPITSLFPSKVNPRKNIDAASLEGLALSIKENGIIEPLVVRPMDAGGTMYEIVAGERRFQAATLAGLKEVPVITRVLDDREAYNVMIVENLQREDLSDHDQAEAFALFIEKNGEGAAEELSSKTGLTPQYIRRKAAVMKLPKDVLALWQKDKLSFAQVEQFVRVFGSKDYKEFKTWALRGGQICDVDEMRNWIARASVPLAAVEFEKSACQKCPQNTSVQNSLFGTVDKRSVCLSPTCYREKARAWFKDKWTELPFKKKHGTNAIDFYSDHSWSDRNQINFEPPAKCLECAGFVTVLQDDYRPYCDRACIGNPSCYKSAYKAAEAPGEKKSTSKKSGAKKDGGDVARVWWHGEYFRQKHFRKMTGPVVSNVGFDEKKTPLPISLLLSLLAIKSHSAEDALAKHFGFKSAGFIEKEKLLDKIAASARSAEIIEGAAKATIAAVLESGEYKSGWDNGEVNPKYRQIIFEKFLGVDLKKTWVPDEEYFEKKTTVELVSFIAKFKVDTMAEFRKYVEKHFQTKNKAVKYSSLKKSQLVEALVKSGVKLEGCVPTELLEEATK